MIRSMPQVPVLENSVGTRPDVLSYFRLFFLCVDIEPVFHRVLGLCAKAMGGQTNFSEGVVSTSG